ncbi:GNAT family N-acetyltransferase [Rhizobium tropici]|uniref:GNAT family N-acetyltransferase n=1 Tax=Rhizobium tropici TaxID=398 RepID=A0A329YA22_RHITR|nr:GNAT family N-acetyltransferase [Rhizobium tropici]RAX40277.1 GNAT family N-acetyltransferase [Rhizobium tropici]
MDMSPNTRGMLIRRLSIDDVEIFRRIRLEALSCDPSSFASVHDDWVDLSDEEWRNRLNEPVFVAFINGEPVGMMGLSRYRPRKMAHRATLVSVYVRKSARGTGIAADLLATVSDYARSLGITQLELAVNAKNAVAVQFYRRHGFVEVGRIPGGVLDGGREVDDIIMVWRLDG